MKNNIRIFLFSFAILAIGYACSYWVSVELSEPLMAQAEAISYMVTLAGIVVVFSWYKRTAKPVAEGAETPDENLKKQHTILKYMLAISVVNAGILVVNTDEPARLMALIGLVVILISPVIFRTMQEQEKYSEETDNEKDKTEPQS